MFKFKQNTFRLILKLGIHNLEKKEETRVKNINNYILGQTHSKNIILNLDFLLLTLYNLIIFIKLLLKKNGKILFVENSANFSQVIKTLAKLNNQYHIIEENWIGGTITNFNIIKWQYYLKNINLGYKAPDLIIMLDSFWSKTILQEINRKSLPVLSPLNFIERDNMINYFLIGNYNTFTTACFITKILDLSLAKGANNKLKYKKLVPIKPKHEFEIIKRKWKKKRGIFVRSFKKQIVFLRPFRPLLKKKARRKTLIRNMFSKYYNITRRKKGNPRVLIKKNKLKQKKKRLSNFLQNFLASYEKRLTSVLYKLKICKNRTIAQKLIDNKLVFINNIPAKGKNFLIKNNDMIQLNYNYFRENQIKKFIKKWKRISRQTWLQKRKLRTKRGKLLWNARKKLKTKKKYIKKFQKKLFLQTSNKSKTLIELNNKKLWGLSRKYFRPKFFSIKKNITKTKNNFKIRTSILKNKKTYSKKQKIKKTKKRSKNWRISIKKKTLLKCWNIISREKNNLKKNKKKYQLKVIKRFKKRKKLYKKLNTKNLYKHLKKTKYQLKLSKPYIYTNSLKLKSNKNLNKIKKNNFLKKNNLQLISYLKRYYFKNSKISKRINISWIKKILTKKKLKKKFKHWKRRVWFRRKIKFNRIKNKRAKKSKFLKNKNWPRNFFKDTKTGTAIYLYTPNTQKILMGKYLTTKRLKLIAN